MSSAPWIWPRMMPWPSWGTCSSVNEASSVWVPWPAVKLVRLFSSVRGWSEFLVVAPCEGAQNIKPPSGAAVSHGAVIAAGSTVDAFPSSFSSGMLSFQPARLIPTAAGGGAAGPAGGAPGPGAGGRTPVPRTIHKPPARTRRATAAASHCRFDIAGSLVGNPRRITRPRLARALTEGCGHRVALAGARSTGGWPGRTSWLVGPHDGAEDLVSPRFPIALTRLGAAIYVL